MKNLIFLILILLVGIVGYTYFFGKGEDKEKAREIVSETKELGRSVGDFLKRQKDKYDDGHLDRLFDRIDNVLDKEKNDGTVKTEEEVGDLKELEVELKKIEPEKLTDADRERLRKLLQDLEKELEDVN